jgi:hypothetical protein
VKKKAAAKKKLVSKKSTRGAKPKIAPATERMAYRLTMPEKLHLQALALAANRSDANYARDLVVTHLKSNPLKE